MGSILGFRFEREGEVFNLLVDLFIGKDRGRVSLYSKILACGAKEVKVHTLLVGNGGGVVLGLRKLFRSFGFVSR